MAQCAALAAPLLTIARTSSRLSTDILCHKHVGKSYAEHVNEERHNVWGGLSSKPDLLNGGFSQEELT